MDECDVCGKPTDLTCGKCFQAVYCSADCQHADHEEHLELECFHPSEMTAEQLKFEVELEMEYPLHDGNDFLITSNMDHEDLIGILNTLRRGKTKVKVAKNKSSLRRERRKTRRANRGTRVANRGTKQKKKLNRARGRRMFAEKKEKNARSVFDNT